MEQNLPFIWTNSNPLHQRILWAEFHWNWPSGSWEEDFLFIFNIISQFHNYLPLERRRTLHLNQHEFPSTKETLCQVLLKLVQWFWGIWFFKFVNVFSQFCNYLPLEKGVAHHLKNLKPLHPRILCPKLHWNWLSGSGEEDFFNLSMYIAIPHLSSLGKGHGPSFEKLEFPTPKDDLPLIWLKLDQWFWRSRFFKFSIYFRNFAIISPLIRAKPFIWTNLNPFHLRMLMPSMVEIGPLVLEKMKMWKVYNNNRQQTNFDQKSSLEPSAQVS